MSIDDTIIGKSENGREIHHSISGYHVHVGESELSCDRQGNTHNPIDEPIILTISSLLGTNIAIQQQQFFFMQEQERRERMFWDWVYGKKRKQREERVNETPKDVGEVEKKVIEEIDKPKKGKEEKLILANPIEENILVEDVIPYKSKPERECPIYISICGYVIKGLMIGAILFGAYVLYDCVNRNFLASKDYTWGTHSWECYIKDEVIYTSPDKERVGSH